MCLQAVSGVVEELEGTTESAWSALETIMQESRPHLTTILTGTDPPMPQDPELTTMTSGARGLANTSKGQRQSANLESESRWLNSGFL